MFFASFRFPCTTGPSAALPPALMARRSFLLARTAISSATRFSLMALHPWFGFASSLTVIYSCDTCYYNFTHSLQPDALPTAATARAGEDIVDPKAYSFEQAKQRMELDRRMRTAEEKKMDDRRAVRTLRKQFEQILAEVSNCLWGGCLFSSLNRIFFSDQVYSCRMCL